MLLQPRRFSWCIQLVSFVVIVIIMAVAANTMTMTVRERLGEYAVFKTLGFGGYRIAAMILGESLFIAVLGGTGGICSPFRRQRPLEVPGRLLPRIFSDRTEIFQGLARWLIVGMAAAVFPTWRAVRIPISKLWGGSVRWALLFSYSLRNLSTRRLTTVLTASGMALVVFVFASILMLAEGLQKTLVDTGSSDNVVVIRRSSGSEVQSGVDRVQASIVETQPEIASGRGAGRSWPRNWWF